MNEALDCAVAADLEYWSKMPYWSLNEALALSFGWEPNRQAELTSAPLAYVRHQELILRAHKTAALTDPINPADFVQWVLAQDLPFPSALAEAISLRHRNQPNWKAEAEQWKEKERLASEAFDYHKAQSAKKSQLIAKLEEEIQALKAAASSTLEPKSLSRQKSFNTLLKLVGGMAMALYNYNPHERRSDTIRQIQNDLDLKGINLDADTIRKWVKEGAALVQAAASLRE